MKILLTISLLTLSITTQAGEEIKKIIDQYKPIETVDCRLRRTVENGSNKSRFISRVYYTNKDQLHADNIAPIKRKTIADGTNLYQYIEGKQKAFSRPITELSNQMTKSLRAIPGSPISQLMHLQNMPENVVKINDDEKQIEIETDTNYTVIKVDSKNRIQEIIYYTSKDNSEEIAKYEFSNYREVLPNTWIAFQQDAELKNSGRKINETLKIDSFIVNKPIDEKLFNHKNFIDEKVEFVDDLAKTLQ